MQLLESTSDRSIRQVRDKSERAHGGMCVQHGCIKVGRWSVDSVHVVLTRKEPGGTRVSTARVKRFWPGAAADLSHFTTATKQPPIRATRVHKVCKSDVPLGGFLSRCFMHILYLQNLKKNWNAVKSLFEACERWKSLWAMESYSQLQKVLLIIRSDTSTSTAPERNVTWQRHKPCVD